MKYIGAIVILLGTASFAFAGSVAPEIDGSSVAAALALVSGGLLVLRGRRKR
jgi:hypothetical protein